MDDYKNLDTPKIYPVLEATSKAIGFTMPSDLYVGSILKTLIASKPASNFLELGTGVGLSLSWMIDGMDAASRLTTVDNDENLVAIANDFFGDDTRVTIVCQDGTKWIKQYNGKRFDLVFADAWPGKFSEIAEVLALIEVGGFYVIDDMDTEPNWPEGHQEKVDKLVSYLEHREDFYLTKMNWSTGLIIATRRS